MTRCFRFEPGAGDGMPQRTFAKPVEVQITGSILIYDINDPLGGKGEPVKALSAQFPDLRRFIREGYVRYAFTRFGVPYVVSIQCLDSTPRARRLACREAYPVAERFLKALRVAGGLPSRPRMDTPVKHCRAAGGARRLISPIGRAATSSPIRAIANRAAEPIIRLIRKFDFRWRKPPLSSTRNNSGAADRATKRLTSWQAEMPAIPGGIIFAKPAVLMSDSAPAVLAIRERTSAPRHVRHIVKAPSAATPSSREWSLSATAS